METNQIFDDIPLELWEEFDRIGNIAYGARWSIKRQELLASVWSKTHVLGDRHVRFLINGIYNHYCPIGDEQEIEVLL